MRTCGVTLVRYIHAYARNCLPACLHAYLRTYLPYLPPPTTYLSTGLPTYPPTHVHKHEHAHNTYTTHANARVHADIHWSKMVQPCKHGSVNSPAICWKLLRGSRTSRLRKVDLTRQLMLCSFRAKKTHWDEIIPLSIPYSGMAVVGLAL